MTPQAVIGVVLITGVLIVGSTPPYHAAAAPVAQVLRVNMENEPGTLDPALIDSRTAGTIAKQLFEGLTRLDKDGTVIPAVAERWQVTPDGKTYTFTLRRNARWSNGDPVTASDFVYSYRRALNPKTGAPFVDNLFSIANAEQYNDGKITDPVQVGVRALDDYTLEIRLHTPAPFFLKVLSFFSVMPVVARVDQQNPKWMNEASTFVSNGPFRLAQWTHEQKIVLERNPHYWARDRVKLDQIQVVMVLNPVTAYQMFVAGQLDISTPPAALTGRLIAERKAQVLPEARTNYLRLNNKVSPFTNVNIRKAFSLALNREGITRRIFQGGQIPLLGYVPHGLSSGTGEFRKQAGDLFKDNDLQRAREYLRQGMKELGINELPPLAMRTSSRELFVKIAQAVQAQWKQTLKADVTIETMEQRAFTAAVRRKDYVIVPWSNGADYDDAINFLGQYISDDFFNLTQYASREYDRLIRAATAETNGERRTRFMIDAERILIVQDMAIAPLFTSTRVAVQNPRLKNVYRYAAADDDYRDAFFAP